MNTPETAPKDENFLGYFGYPWFVMTRWNAASGKWVYANLQCGTFRGRWNDYYFENEYELESELRGWLPLPTFNAESKSSNDH